MNRIALGTVQFGLPYGIANQTGQVTREEAGLMLDYAASCGITILDTAIAYGESEACLGAVGVKNFKVISKLPSLPDNILAEDVRGWVQNQVSASLSRLDVPALYGLLLHNSSQLTGRFAAPLAAALLELKSQGLVDKLGVSIYAPQELEVIDKVLPYDLIQAPFNLLDRRLLHSGWLRHLKERGVEVHTRSTYLQGLLLMPSGAIPNAFSQWAGLLHRWHQWLAQHDLSALQACLAFTLSHSEIDQVVVGADSLKHLEQILTAAPSEIGSELPDLTCDDLNLIDPSRWKK